MKKQRFKFLAWGQHILGTRTWTLRPCLQNLCSNHFPLLLLTFTLCFSTHFPLTWDVGQSLSNGHCSDISQSTLTSTYVECNILLSKFLDLPLLGSCVLHLTEWSCFLVFFPSNPTSVSHQLLLFLPIKSSSQLFAFLFLYYIYLA